MTWAGFRSQVAPHYHVNALERFLQAAEPEARPMQVEPFLLPEFQTPPQRNHWYAVIGSTDPKLDELLAEVWQPFWAHAPVELWADPDCPYRGREIALRRRGTTKPP